MTKIEQVARAIRARVPAGYGMTEAESMDYARAAIEAVPFPTQGMIEAAQRLQPGLCGLQVIDLWQAMIAAALRQQEG